MGDAKARMEMVSLGKFKSAVRNPKDHDIPALKASIRRFGFNDFPTVNEATGRYVEGHGRVVALKEMKRDGESPPRNVVAKGRQWFMPVIRGISFASEHEAEAYLVAHNQQGVDAGWNDDLLAQVLQNVDFEQDGMFEAIGFERDRVEALIGQFETPEPRPAVEEDDVPPLPADPVTRPGDVWTLGRHQLVCGDSLDRDVALMSRAMGTPAMVLVEGDDHAYDPAHIFRDFGDVKEIFLWGADYYAERIPDRNAGSWLVWDKAGSADAPNDDYDKMFGSNFELCWSRARHKRALIRVLWKGIFGLASEDTRARVHPTQKPARLALWFLERFHKSGGVVVDLFAGSGFLLVAAERAAASSFNVELDPRYCDVVVERWENLTGDKATRSAL